MPPTRKAASEVDTDHSILKKSRVHDEQKHEDENDVCIGKPIPLCLDAGFSATKECDDCTTDQKCQSHCENCSLASSDAMKPKCQTHCEESAQDSDRIYKCSPVEDGQANEDCSKECATACDEATPTTETNTNNNIRVEHPDDKPCIKTDDKPCIETHFVTRSFSREIRVSEDGTRTSKVEAHENVDGKERSLNRIITRDSKGTITHDSAPALIDKAVTIPLLDPK